MTEWNEAGLAEKRDAIAERLSRKWWRFGAARDPELRKHLQRIADRLEAARREEAIRKDLGSLAEFDPHRLDLDSALSLSARLDEFVFARSDDAGLLCAAAEAELPRTDTTVVTWKGLFGEDPDDVPEAVEVFRQGGEPSGPPLESLKHKLSVLAHSRHEDYQLLRTRRAMKGQHLRYLGLGLLIAIAAFAWELVRGGVLTFDDVLLGMAAGAVGALMGGTFKLRDTVSHINDLRAYRSILAVQPLLGAGAALFLLLALETHVLSVGGAADGLAARGLLGFVAGFSEPFFLKTVARVTSLVEKKGGEQGAGERSGAGSGASTNRPP